VSIIVQEDLFRAADRTLPEGFRYSAEIVRPDLQRMVLEAMPTLAFKAFDFHGFEGKRRTVSFGWKYDFDTQRVRRADAMPSVLLSIREVVARFAGIEPDALVQALVTEYGPGALRSAGTRTNSSSAGSSVSPCSRLAPSGSGGVTVPNGSGDRSSLNPARPISWLALLERSGNIPSRPSTACVIRSPSGNWLNRPPIGNIGLGRWLLRLLHRWR
jgi:hypothetical protein